MSKTVCRICLRSGFDKTKDIDEKLKDFHGELCYYDVSENDTMEFCGICHHQLRKFYNFRQKCLRAQNIIKSSGLKNINLKVLEKLMPPALEITTATDCQEVYKYNDTSCIYPIVNSQYTDENSIQKFITSENGILEIDPMCITQIKLENTDNYSIPENVLNDIEINEQNNLKLPNKQYIQKNKIHEQNDLKVPNEHDLHTKKFLEQSDINGSKQKPIKIKKAIFISNNKNLSVLNLLIPKKEKNASKLDECIELRDRIVRLIDKGMIDLGEVAVNKEMFLKMFEKCDKRRLRAVLIKGPGGIEKLKKFLLFLLKRYNPEYESVFDIEYLTTRDAKLAEFNARRRSAEYTGARHRCDTCYRAFELPNLLDYHNKWHDASRPHACDICSMRFFARKLLMRHIRCSHYAVYRCKLCPIVTNDPYAMENHYEQHKGVRYTCDVCLREYSTRSTMRSHRQCHSTLACSLCARRFVSALSYTNHMKLKHPGAASTESQESETLRKQTPMQQKTYIYKCAYPGCAERFSTAAAMRGHALATGHAWRGVRARAAGTSANETTVCEGTDTYTSCPICCEKVLMKSTLSLYKHHSAAHPAVPYRPCARGMLCELCGKECGSRAKLLIHQRTHTGERPFQCSLCPKTYSTLFVLQFHMRTHTGERPFPCRTCPKAFTNKVALLRHERVHTGEKPYACPMCPKAFSQSNSMKLHLSTVHLKQPAPIKSKNRKRTAQPQLTNTNKVETVAV